MNRFLRPIVLPCVTLTAVGSMLVTAGAAAAAEAPRSVGAVEVSNGDRELTPEQIAFITDFLGPKAVAELEETLSKAPAGDRAAAIPAAVIAAAAWCGRGALASIPTSALSDMVKGDFSGKGEYVRNAVIACLVGEVGAWAWKVLPGWLKEKAVAAVIAFLIKYHR